MQSLIREKRRKNLELDGPIYQQIYNRSPAGSGIRRWLVDTVLTEVESVMVDCLWGTFPTEMAKDMLKVLLDIKEASGKSILPKEVNASKYYDWARISEGTAAIVRIAGQTTDDIDDLGMFEIN